MHKHLIKWLSENRKKEKGLPHMLVHRRRFLDYSKVYSDVTERWLLAWNQSRNIRYYIIQILILKSLLVFLPDILPHLDWWLWLHHCATLVCNLPTSILVRAAVSLLTFHVRTNSFCHYGFTYFKRYSFLNLSISTRWLVLVEDVQQHRRFSELVVWN